MSRFRYRAKRGPKEMVEGFLDADSQEAAVKDLIGQGFVPMQVMPAAAEEAQGLTRPPSVRGIQPFEVTLLTAHLASLLRSRIPVLRGLELIQGHADRPGVRHVAGQIAHSVREGKTLSEAFGRFPHLFPPLYRSIIRAGELSGQMDAMLARLVEYRQQQEALRSKVQMALVYPLFLLAVGVATVAVLLTVVVPRLAGLFQEMQQGLPWPTRCVIAASRFLRQAWWLWAAGLLGCGVVFSRGAGPGQVILERFQLFLPFWRRLTHKVEVARFCRTLGMLLESKVPILQAVDSAIPTVSNRFIRASLKRLPGSVASGTPLSQSLKHVPAFSPLEVGIIALGEESGELPQQLFGIAGTLEAQVEDALKALTSLVEPTLILVLGAVIGLIVAAVFLPVFQVGSGLFVE